MSAFENNVEITTDTVKDFEEQFPDVDAVPAGAIVEPQDEDDEPQINVAEVYPDIDQPSDQYVEQEPQPEQYTYSEPSVAVSQWQERRELEISDADRRNEQEKIELQEDAVKHIDEFYENYNKKKQQQLDQVKTEAENFLKQRDEFQQQDNTTWDRILQLINEDDSSTVGGRDRSKFKEILKNLSGKPNVPGA